MVLTASETIEIENLKHSHELQILNRREEIAKSEHERSMGRLKLEKEIAVIPKITIEDERVVKALENLSYYLEQIQKYGLRAYTGKM